MADNLKPAQLQPFTLAGSGTVIGATTIVLKSFKSIPDVNGTPTSLLIGDFGTQGFGTLEPGSLSQEEQFVFTGVTQNGDGTATLTGVKPVLFLSPYTQGGAGLTKSHAGGVIMVITNSSGYYDTFANKNNDETINNRWVFPGIEATRPNLAVDVDAIANTALITHGELARATFAGTVDASTVQKGIVELSTIDEQDDGTATGGTGAFLVPQNSNITEARVNIVRYIAGENIDASVTPQAVYLKASDGKVYKSSAATAVENCFSFIGFAVFGQNITINNVIRVQVSGQVLSFTGLTAGSSYFLADAAGTISTTPGTIVYKIGVANSTGTKLLISLGQKVVSSETDFGSTTSTTITVGFRPSKVTVFASTNFAAACVSNGGWFQNGGNNCIEIIGTANLSGYVSGKAWSVIESGGNSHVGLVDTITSSGFNLNNTKTGAPGTARILWIAEG